MLQQRGKYCPVKEIATASTYSEAKICTCLRSVLYLTKLVHYRDSSLSLQHIMMHLSSINLNIGLYCHFKYGHCNHQINQEKKQSDVMVILKTRSFLSLSWKLSRISMLMNRITSSYLQPLRIHYIECCSIYLVMIFLHLSGYHRNRDYIV